MARPFLKWAGGKARLAPLVVGRAPNGFGRYFEPFVGAGAVFFAVRDAGFHGEALLSDANGQLVDCFKAVRDEALALHADLERLAEAYMKSECEQRAAMYYELRAKPPGDPVAAAARLIFLNKTCYNGLYRVNASGGFNVPHGRYRKPSIPDRELLCAAAAALRRTRLETLDFEAACERAKRNDFVYLDPPYHPLSATSSFTAYTKGDFGASEQVRLRDVFEGLTRRGAWAMLSNSDHHAIRELYEGQGYGMETVSMARAINSKGTGRGAIGELLIDNFERVRAGLATQR
jgi:DNA adenine methylase